MMIISADNQLPFPRDLVYATYRDRLSDLVPYMANVSSIQAKSRQETEGKIGVAELMYDMAIAKRCLGRSRSKKIIQNRIESLARFNR